MSETSTAYYKSPIGIFKLTGADDAVHSIEFTELESASDEVGPDALGLCCQQLDEYFNGTRHSFELPLRPQGTDFQKSVWQELLEIPFGETRSYMDIARALGKEAAVRAVGAANGRNRIPVIIPCHRVIGSNGALIGFGGGIWRKEYLLKHENVVLL